MEQKTTTQPSSSSQMWERLEAFVREQVQQFIQALLEEEVTRACWDGPNRPVGPPWMPPRAAQRIREAPAAEFNRGTITVRRPRVRGLGERFVSRVLPLFKRRTREVGELLPQLYLHGLALGDFDLALRGLLGDAAPLSPASLARLKAQLAARV